MSSKREDNGEYRTLMQDATGGNRSSMMTCNFPAYCEPDTCSFVGRLVMKALKNGEDLFCILFLETYAIVGKSQSCVLL